MCASAPSTPARMPRAGRPRRRGGARSPWRDVVDLVADPVARALGLLPGVRGDLGAALGDVDGAVGDALPEVDGEPLDLAGGGVGEPAAHDPAADSAARAPPRLPPRPPGRPPPPPGGLRRG